VRLTPTDFRCFCLDVRRGLLSEYQEAARRSHSLLVTNAIWTTPSFPARLPAPRPWGSGFRSCSRVAGGAGSSRVREGDRASIDGPSAGGGWDCDTLPLDPARRRQRIAVARRLPNARHAPGG